MGAQGAHRHSLKSLRSGISEDIQYSLLLGELGKLVQEIVNSDLLFGSKMGPGKLNGRMHIKATRLDLLRLAYLTS